MLYLWDVRRQPLREIEESMALLQDASPEARAFAHELVAGTLRRMDEIDGRIEAHAKDWRVDRMAAVERNVLRAAVYEFMELPTPKSVVIDEALSVVKRFSTPDAVSFVNGVLDAVCTSLETAPESG